MLTEEDILHTLDHSNDGYYRHFVWLGDVYSYLIDARLNVFRNDADQWAIAIERLGYSPRAGYIRLEIYYYGNCLVNLEEYNHHLTNYYELLPCDWDAFLKAAPDEVFNRGDETILIRGVPVSISHDREEYRAAGIEWKEYQPGEIQIEEAARLLVTKHRPLLRATDAELYKSIPQTLKKVLVLDEWYHHDFQLDFAPSFSQEELDRIYQFNQELTGKAAMDFDSFADSVRHQEMRSKSQDWQQWEQNRPSVYETWQQVAKVIVTGDTSFYRPSMSPNTHWSNYPESGSL